MAKRRRKVLATVLLGALLLIVVMAAIDLLRPIPPEQRLRQLHERMTAMRDAAESCLQALEAEEAELLASDARFDSLRDRIEYYESLDPRGVPADSYATYLEAFNEYNQGIPAREAAGDSLTAHWEACRRVIARHNAIADSARALATELDLVRDSVVRVPVGAPEGREPEAAEDAGPES